MSAMDLKAHAQWIPYTTPKIAELSWDPISRTHIPFRAQRNHLHQNWAQIHSSRPELFLRPQSTLEIRLIVNLARTCRKRIVVVGSRHSPNDLTCTNSWMISLDDFQDVLGVAESKSEITIQSGMRLYQLQRHLDELGWAMPNLGSISEQSISGAISTASHGATLRHGLISDDITGLTLMLSSGEEVHCTKDDNRDLFLAALVSLGGLGIITSITFKAVSAFNLEWVQEVLPVASVVSRWSSTTSPIWNRSEYERIWWYPYSRKALLWHADKTKEPLRDVPSTWFGGTVGYHINQLFLYVTVFFPSFTPFAERFMFRMEYGHADTAGITKGVQTSVAGMSMNCLYKQFVNEWSIPFASGAEALSRLQAWLEHKPQSEHKIPFDSTGVYAHCPIEVRPSFPSSDVMDSRPFLETLQSNEPSLYINATLFRPYGMDIPSRERYYEAFEWLMKQYNGRPHWAKNFTTLSKQDFASMYSEKGRLGKWLDVRRRTDPDGVFMNDFIKRNLIPDDELEELQRPSSATSTDSFELMKASEISFQSLEQESSGSVSPPLLSTTQAA